MKFVIIERSTGNIVQRYERDDYLKHQAWGGMNGSIELVEHLEVPLYMDWDFLIQPVPTDAQGDFALAEDTTAKTAAQKVIDVKAAYDKMVSDSLAQMASTFGTTSTESATAYERTWEKMIATPSDYSSAGLTARFDRGGLLTGQPLDTDQKVLDYANACIALVNAYGVWRMQRIEQFRSEKATIESA